MTDCMTCHERPARVCSECARAVALQQWDGVARHDEGATCVLCERGAAVYCPQHFLDRVVEHHEDLREMRYQEHQYQRHQEGYGRIG